MLHTLVPSVLWRVLECVRLIVFRNKNTQKSVTYLLKREVLGRSGNATFILVINVQQIYGFYQQWNPEQVIFSLFHVFLFRKTVNRTLPQKGELPLKNKTQQPEWGGGSYFPYILLNEIQTVFSQLGKAIIKGLASGFVYWSCLLRHKPKINGLEKEQNQGVRRRDCISPLYFGNSQLYWFYVAFQTF